MLSKPGTLSGKSIRLDLVSQLVGQFEGFSHSPRMSVESFEVSMLAGTSIMGLFAGVVLVSLFVCDHV